MKPKALRGATSGRIDGLGGRPLDLTSQAFGLFKGAQRAQSKHADRQRHPRSIERGQGWHIAESNEQQAQESAAMAHSSAGIHGQAFDPPILCHSGFDAFEIHGIRRRMLVNQDLESCLWK